jgi:hypothetical protein
MMRWAVVMGVANILAVGVIGNDVAAFTKTKF